MFSNSPGGALHPPDEYENESRQARVQVRVPVGVLHPPDECENESRLLRQLPNVGSGVERVHLSCVAPFSFWFRETDQTFREINRRRPPLREPIGARCSNRLW